MGNFNTIFMLVAATAGFTLLEYIPSASANIQCYRCIVAAPVVNYYNETIRLCKDFDYSDKFIVNCPYSTFCMKKIVSAKIPFTINGTERDCASQKLKRHNYLNKQWQVDYVIEDPYQEGCERVDDKGARTTTAEYCYCKGDLCNASNALGANSIRYILFTVITLLVSKPFFNFCVI